LTPAALEAKAATATIPIVFGTGDDSASRKIRGRLREPHRQRADPGQAL